MLDPTPPSTSEVHDASATRTSDAVSESEPLIDPQLDHDHPHNPHHQHGSPESGLAHDLSNRKPTAYVWLLTAVAGLSGLLFGYDTGIISSTLLHLSPSLSADPGVELSDLAKSIITSSTSLAALFASVVAGVLADRHGRKPIIYLADFLFVLGALWQACATNVTSMVIGRFVVGLGVGVGSGVVPMYIAELAPAGYRGRLTTLYTGCITGGQLLAYAVGWWAGATFSEEASWRVGVGLGAVPAIAQAIGLLWQPESPRWLVMRRKKKEATVILGRVLGLGKAGDGYVKRLVKEIEDGVREAENSELGSLKEKWIDLWGDRHGRKALGVACMVQALQQLCGFNSLMYFSATIFALIGFNNPTATSMIIAGTNLLFTLMAFTLIDRIGRRLTLLISIPGMVLGLLLSAFAFDHLPLTPSVPSASSNAPPAYAVIILISMTLYVASYASGIGTVPWTAQNEIFKMQHRGLGSGISTGVNWAGNFVVGITFLEFMRMFGGKGVFCGYAVVCVFGWVGVWMWFEDRSGMELEQEEGEGEAGRY
ncbi:general substrate transporter [Peziza echinospora]|nr:general substrate transporter [Peziza echinospora]